MSVFHLLNPSRKHAAWVRSLTTARRLLFPWAQVARDHPDHTETLVEWALREKVKRLVVWGGDGTLNRVVRALWGRKATADVDLALVPVGTCNDLARRMGLSRDNWGRWDRPPEDGPAPDEARHSLAVGLMEWREPSGVIAQTIFLNNAGFGRPRESFERKDPPWKTIGAFSPIPTSIRWSAGEVRGLYYMALFCLGPYFSGGLHFEKGPSPEDAVLRAYMIPARSKPRLAARLLAGRLGLPLGDDKITKITATHLRLLTDAPVWPQADGEPPPAEGVRELEVKVLPNRWRLWTPTKADALAPVEIPLGLASPA